MQELKGSIIFPLKIIIQILFTVAMQAQPISITDISLDKSTASFLSTIAFTFTFQANHAITAPLEWKIVYVGSAKDEAYDQILEEFEINSVELGKAMKFTVECAPPSWEKIPRQELLRLTAIIITVAYRQQEFVRIGYYVHIQADGSASEANPSSTPTKDLVKHLTRTILIDKPRITKFKINLASQQNDSAAKSQHILSTPTKNDKAEHSNTSLSISKTACNEKQSQLTDLPPLPPLPTSLTKKQKKIKKSTRITAV